MAPFDGRYLTSYQMAIVMFALSLPDFLSDGNSNVCSVSHRLRDIRQNNEMPKVLTLKMKSQGVKESDLRYSTGNVRIHICDFFNRILAIWVHTFTQTEYTQTHSERQG